MYRITIGSHTMLNCFPLLTSLLTNQDSCTLLVFSKGQKWQVSKYLKYRVRGGAVRGYRPTRPRSRGSEGGGGLLKVLKVMWDCFHAFQILRIFAWKVFARKILPHGYYKVENSTSKKLQCDGGVSASTPSNIHSG